MSLNGLGIPRRAAPLKAALITPSHSLRTAPARNDRLGRLSVNKKDTTLSHAGCDRQLVQGQVIRVNPLTASKKLCTWFSSRIRISVYGYLGEMAAFIGLLGIKANLIA